MLAFDPLRASNPATTGGADGTTRTAGYSGGPQKNMSKRSAPAAVASE
jgi:hypothetical protein